ncbi:TetR family transcriptional regulator [Tamaricihabitans halophyticus]|uniref:TetR family transcriptional regulator n=1 Tax=Tamaricihabitans halophyticus TaxID=1262583 RepID=A0A4R2QZA2_9PSEU|nr:TetR/AcrR family transcriptional regulator [Tamaricihabitans halophyticus]TCP55007.1 TetR family transcriptional regulator [Tamaricihabitans halophyticus]
MGRWQQTHEALRRAALELFLEQGYDATPTAQIADLAGVTEMTLFRHFGTKEALLLEDPYDPLMAEAVRTRPPGESSMRALAEGIRQQWHQLDPESTAALCAVLRVVAETSALRGALERGSATTVTALADALVIRGAAADEARVAATAVIAGLSTALLEWAQATREPAGQVSLTDVVDRALSVLGGD